MAEKKAKLPVIPADDPSLHPDAQSCRKMGLSCQGCELFEKKRVPGEGATGHVDIMLVSESPSSWSVNNQQVFYGRGGRVIRKMWSELKELDARSGGHLRMRHLAKWDTYAVQCQVEDGRDQNATASAATIQRCSGYLRSAVKNKQPKIIVAFGATALKALGYKAGTFTDARGRLLDVDINGQTYKVLPTFSTKHIQAKTGLYNLFYADFIRAVRIASGVDDASAGATIEEITKEYVIPRTVEEVRQVCDTIITHVVEGAKTADQCAVAVDTETNTVNPHRKDAKLLCVSFAWDSGRATAIPLFHRETPWNEAELAEVVGHVRRVLECPKPKVFHNAKFDLKFIELRHKWRVNNVAWDSMLGEHLLREDMTGSYGLKVLGRTYFPAFGNYADKVHELAEQLTPEEEGTQATLKNARKGKVKKGTVGIEDGLTFEMSKKELEAYLFGTKRERRKRVFDAGYERVPIDTLLLYAGVDTDLTRRLLRHQFGRMQQEHFQQAARGLMASHCVPASRRLGQMEFDGFRVDRPYLEMLKVDLGKIVDEKRVLLDRMWDPDERSKGVEFNPNSTQHIGHILFNKGVLDPETGKRMLREGPWLERNKKSGKWKTDKKTLKAIAERLKCGFSKSLLEYRAAHKALTGFVQDIDVLSEYDGFLHTSFHLHGTSTGRLSSSNVNMQNQPKKLAGVNIKKIFIPDDPEEEVIFNVDWKGAEIRVFTAYAPDEQLITALNGGLDVHSWFTQEIFGIPYEDVERLKDIDDTMNKTRVTVKRVVFGILYGAMAKKIAETAGISEEEAQKVIDKLFERFPSLRNYMDEVVSQIHTRGFVETFFGRRRRFPLQNVNGFFRGQAERRGKNMKIQSTSSDIVVSQLIEIGEHIGELGGRLCITVHDSIVGTIKKKYLSQAQAFFDYYCVTRVREKYPWLPVDFAHDISVGPSYGETIALADYIKKNAPQQLTPEQEFLELLDQDALVDLAEDDTEHGRKGDSMFAIDDGDDEDAAKAS
jgi:uracil-DNA glycosylase family 4